MVSFLRRKTNVLIYVYIANRISYILAKTQIPESLTIEN